MEKNPRKLISPRRYSASPNNQCVRSILQALLDVATVVDPSTRLEAFELTVLMALHPRGSIRSEALHSLGKLLEDDPDNLQEILGGFKAWMLALAGEKVSSPQLLMSLPLYVLLFILPFLAVASN